MRHNLITWRAVVSIDRHANPAQRPSIVYTLTVRCPLCTDQHDLTSPKWSLLERFNPANRHVAAMQEQRLVYTLQTKMTHESTVIALVVRSSLGEEVRPFAKQQTCCPHCGIVFGLTEADRDRLQDELTGLSIEWAEDEIQRLEHEAADHDLRPSDYGRSWGMTTGPPKALMQG